MTNVTMHCVQLLLVDIQWVNKTATRLPEVIIIIISHHCGALH
jgi:hypothetical protein